MRIFEACVLLVLTFALLGGTMSLLKERYSVQVRMMWFAFSLMYVLSTGFAIYAAKAGWIAADGSLAQNTAGNWISKGIHFMLDVGGTLTAILYVLAGLILVYLIAYIPTAICGCASGVGVIPHAVDISTVFFLKGFASAAAVILAIFTCNAYYHWYEVDTAQALGAVAIVIGFLGLGFAILYMQIEKSALIKWMESRVPAWLFRIHMRATKHSRNEEKFGAALLSSSSRLAFLLAQNKVGHNEFRADMIELIDLARGVQSSHSIVRDQEGENSRPHKDRDEAQLRKEMRISELREKWDI